MPLEFDGTKEILERMLSSYGVRSRMEYGELVGIPIPTINNWVSRDNVPGNYIIQCALDTGADLEWLVSGNLANASFKSVKGTQLQGKPLYDKILKSGGKPVLNRILAAYGFTMQKELGDMLDLSSGTISTWIRREYFPGDVVVACAIDTGVSLAWLATGEGSPDDNQVTGKGIEPSLCEIPFYKLEDGELCKDGVTFIDSRIFPDNSKPTAFITGGINNWYVDLSNDRMGNGKFLIDIDGYIDIYDVTRLPGNKIKVLKESSTFECSLDDVSCVGQVITTLLKS